MRDDELREKVIVATNEWVNKNFYEKARVFGISSWADDYKKLVRETVISWDEKLNSLDIIRIEHHLGRPHRKNHIRIQDPLVLHFKIRRYLELTREQATKIAFLGIP
jgi:hypothetical protein